MSLLTVSNLGQSFGADDIFSGITLEVPLRARIGLVGPNGVGKTTLLRILAGLDEPTEGQVHRARELRSEYLPQQADLTSDRTLWDECLTAFADLLELEHVLADLEAAMADPARRQQALVRYGPAQEQFEQRGGYTYRQRIRQTLSGLGFQPQDLERPLAQLSGGQRTRALLARLLLSDPDLLILDEPTNHLDIAAVEWLENYLREWDGAAIIVSHDRYFLDRVVDTIWEMSPAGFERYRGNYSAYLEQRQTRWDHRRQIYEAEIARLESELDYIRRNIAGQRTSQAKGRLRRLSRYLEAIEKGGLLAIQGKRWIEISDALDVTGRPMKVDEAGRRIRALRFPPVGVPTLRMHLRPARRSGDLVLRTRELVVGYPEARAPLFVVPDLVLRRGECAALIGPNGAGKTTFLKTLLGQVRPWSGELILGASLEVGYFAQAHEALEPQRTLVEEIQQVAPQMLVAEVRHYLARFLFSGDDVFKKVEVLSGGERGRLALAKLALSDANLLLLDEPTNQLDIPSQEVLQSVLADYEGTILLVSHDRYLIDALGTQIWEIDPQEATLTVFEGTYSEYRAHKEARESQAAERVEVRPAPRTPRRAAGRRPGDGKRERARRARLEQVEAQIQALEHQLRQLSGQLENPPVDLQEVERLGEQYLAVQETLDDLIEEWEQLHR